MDLHCRLKFSSDKTRYLVNLRHTFSENPVMPILCLSTEVDFSGISTYSSIYFSKNILLLLPTFEHKYLCFLLFIFSFYIFKNKLVALV